jgi:hypothetical protein
MPPGWTDGDGEGVEEVSEPAAASPVEWLGMKLGPRGRGARAAQTWRWRSETRVAGGDAAPQLATPAPAAEEEDELAHRTPTRRVREPPRDAAAARGATTAAGNPPKTAAIFAGGVLQNQTTGHGTNRRAVSFDSLFREASGGALETRNVRG